MESKLLSRLQIKPFCGSFCFSVPNSARALSRADGKLLCAEQSQLSQPPLTAEKLQPLHDPLSPYLFYYFLILFWFFFPSANGSIIGNKYNLKI